jgi:hypothetical protein
MCGIVCGVAMIMRSCGAIAHAVDEKIARLCHYCAGTFALKRSSKAPSRMFAGEGDKQF